MTTILFQALAAMLLFLAFLFGVALCLFTLFCFYMAIQATVKLSPEEARHVEARQQAAPHVCPCQHCTELRQRNLRVDQSRG